MKGKVDHTNTTCCVCGKNTYIQIDGKPLWYREKDRYGRHTGKYVCYYCYFGYKRPMINKEISDKICRICGKDKTYIRPNGDPLWYRDYDDNDDWTGKYICCECYQHYDPKSHNNIIKSLRKRRSNISDLDITGVLGDISQEIVAIMFRIKDLNIDKDNYCTLQDFKHEKYGYIDVQGRSPQGKYWMFKGGKNCDTYILLGFSENLEKVESVHIVPNEEWGIKSISISRSRDPSRFSKYDKYKVDHVPYNEIYQKLLGDKK